MAGADTQLQEMLGIAVLVQMGRPACGPIKLLYSDLNVTVWEKMAI